MNRTYILFMSVLFLPLFYFSLYPLPAKSVDYSDHGREQLENVLLGKSLFSADSNDQYDFSSYQEYTLFVEYLASLPLQKSVTVYDLLTRIKPIEGLCPLENFELCMITIHTFSTSLQEFMVRAEHRENTTLYDQISSVQSKLYALRDQRFSQLSFTDKVRVFVRENSASLIKAGIAIPLFILTGLIAKKSYNYLYKRHYEKKQQGEQASEMLKKDMKFRRAVVQSLARDDYTIPSSLKTNTQYASLTQNQGFVRYVGFLFPRVPTMDGVASDECSNLKSQLDKALEDFSLPQRESALQHFKRYLEVDKENHDQVVQSIRNQDSYGTTLAEFLTNTIDPYLGLEQSSGQGNQQSDPGTYQDTIANQNQLLNVPPNQQGKETDTDYDVNKNRGDDLDSDQARQTNLDDNSSHVNDLLNDPVNDADPHDSVVFKDKELSKLFGKESDDLTQEEKQKKEQCITSNKNLASVKQFVYVLELFYNSDFSKLFSENSDSSDETDEYGDDYLQTLENVLSTYVFQKYSNNCVSTYQEECVAYELFEKSDKRHPCYCQEEPDFSGMDQELKTDLASLIQDFEKLHAFATQSYVSRYLWTTTYYDQDKENIIAMLQQQRYTKDNKKLLDLFWSLYKKILINYTSVGSDRRDAISTLFYNAGCELVEKVDREDDA